MTILVFVSAVMALLLAPGPTNTLIGVAGARHGMRTVAHLMPAELLGYMTSILPIVWVGTEVIAQWPAIAELVKVGAAVWIMRLSVKLWMAGRSQSEHKSITRRQIYITTFLNPKAFIFGLVLLPGLYDPLFFGRLLTLAGLVLGVAVVWGGLGIALRSYGDEGRNIVIIHRAASLWLGIISVSLMASLAVEIVA